jgi:hypothetical protein
VVMPAPPGCLLLPTTDGVEKGGDADGGWQPGDSRAWWGGVCVAWHASYPTYAEVSAAQHRGAALLGCERCSSQMRALQTSSRASRAGLVLASCCQASHEARRGPQGLRAARARAVSVFPLVVSHRRWTCLVAVTSPSPTPAAVQRSAAQRISRIHCGCSRGRSCRPPPPCHVWHVLGRIRGVRRHVAGGSRSDDASRWGRTGAASQANCVQQQRPVGARAEIGTLVSVLSPSPFEAPSSRAPSRAVQRPLPTRPALGAFAVRAAE